jgi:hypothetical protein
MAQDESKNQAVVARAPAVPMSVPIGPTTSLDISFLPENERKALMVEYTRGVLDISKKAQELHVDVGVLKNTLETLASTAKDVSESGNAVTIAHTQTTKVGRTEVMIGNTQQAQSGKFSKSQTGERDWKPFYVIGGLIAAVLIAAVAFHH